MLGVLVNNISLLWPRMIANITEYVTQVACCNSTLAGSASAICHEVYQFISSENYFPPRPPSSNLRHPVYISQTFGYSCHTLFISRVISKYVYTLHILSYHANIRVYTWHILFISRKDTFTLDILLCHANMCVHLAHSVYITQTY